MIPQDLPYGPTPPGQRYQPLDYPTRQLSPAPVAGHYPPPTNPLAVLALALGFSCWPLAIVFGHLARRQIARTGESGHGLATAGLVIGYLLLAMTVLTAIAVVALIGATTPAGPGMTP
ncbi:MAG: DUF4190 domain-containing protein [Actinomycetes bacterium]